MRPGKLALDTIENGLKTAFMPNEPVLHGGRVYSADGTADKPLLRAYATDDKSKNKADYKPLWEIGVDGTGRRTVAWVGRSSHSLVVVVVVLFLFWWEFQ